MTKTLFNLFIKKAAPFNASYATKKKAQNKTWVATVKGYYPIGICCCEVYFNLYEGQNGKRTYEEYRGRELNHVPRRADFSAKAQVDAWVNSTNTVLQAIMPQCLLLPLPQEERAHHTYH